MATMQELFLQVSSGSTSSSLGHETETDTGKITCTVDTENRTLTLSDDIIGVVNDRFVERVYFTCPRYVGDYIDLANYTIKIQYENGNGDLGVYQVTDIVIGTSSLTWSWELDRTVTAYAGEVTFSVNATRKQNGVVVREWNTTTAAVTVLEGLETSSSTDSDGGISAYMVEYLLEQLTKKLDTQQSTDNAGKVLTVGDDGKITFTTVSGGSASSHESLTGRSTADQHPISSITGLNTALNELEEDIEDVETFAKSTGYKVTLSCSTDYKVTAKTYDINGNLISESAAIDLSDLADDDTDAAVTALQTMIENGEVEIPVATSTVRGTTISSDSKNSVSVASTGQMTINEIGVEKLSNTDGIELILNGGTA